MSLNTYGYSWNNEDIIKLYYQNTHKNRTKKQRESKEKSEDKQRNKNRKQNENKKNNAKTNNNTKTKKRTTKITKWKQKAKTNNK